MPDFLFGKNLEDNEIFFKNEEREELVDDKQKRIQRTCKKKNSKVKRD